MPSISEPPLTPYQAGAFTRWSPLTPPQHAFFRRVLAACEDFSFSYGDAGRIAECLFEQGIRSEALLRAASDEQVRELGLTVGARILLATLRDERPRETPVSAVPRAGRHAKLDDEHALAVIDGLLGSPTSVLGRADTLCRRLDALPRDRYARFLRELGNDLADSAVGDPCASLDGQAVIGMLRGLVLGRIGQDEIIHLERVLARVEADPSPAPSAEPEVKSIVARVLALPKVAQDELFRGWVPLYGEPLVTDDQRVRFLHQLRNDELGAFELVLMRHELPTSDGPCPDDEAGRLLKGLSDEAFHAFLIRFRAFGFEPTATRAATHAFFRFHDGLTLLARLLQAPVAE